MELCNVSCGYPDRPVLRGISHRFTPGALTALVGRNGSGKTTLLRTLAGFLTPQGGSVRFGGEELWKKTAAQRAQVLSYVPQRHQITFPIEAQEVVAMGAVRRMGLFEAPGPSLLAQARLALKRVGMQEAALRNFLTLSGGEQQLVLLARAIFQEAQVLVLDEPENALDLAHRCEVLRLIQDLCRAEGKTGILALHDPALVLNHCDEVLAVGQGQLLGALSFKTASPFEVQRFFQGVYGPLELLQGAHGRAVIPVAPTDLEQRMEELLKETKERMNGKGQTALLVTGSRGSGKSTFLKFLAAQEPSEALLTRFGTGECDGALWAVTEEGLSWILARREEGGLRLVPGSFVAMQKALEKLLQSPKLRIIDEVGFLEAQERAYLEGLGCLLDQGRCALALRKEPLPHLEAFKAHPNAYLLDMDEVRRAQGW